MNTAAMWFMKGTTTCVKKKAKFVAYKKNRREGIIITRVQFLLVYA